MKIGFWQLERGHGSSTANMIALATYIAETTKIRSVLMQSHFNANNLMQSFYVNKKQGSSESIGEPGIDELMRLISSKKANTDEVASTVHTFNAGKIGILYETFRNNKNLYYEDFLRYHKEVSNAFEGRVDLTFIDIEGGHGRLSKLLRKDCDYIVYNLSQEKLLIDTLLTEVDIDYSKSIFIMGNYDDRNLISLKNVRRMYPQLNEKNSFVVPNCVQFSNAINDTRVIRFMNSIVTDDSIFGVKTKKFKRLAHSDDLAGFIGNIDVISKALLNLTGMNC